MSPAEEHQDPLNKSDREQVKCTISNEKGKKNVSKKMRSQRLQTGDFN